jgi:hypothetical protein
VKTNTLAYDRSQFGHVTDYLATVELATVELALTQAQSPSATAVFSLGEQRDQQGDPEGGRAMIRTCGRASGGANLPGG